MIRRSAGMAFIGIGLGLAGAALLSRFLESYLYEMEPTSPLPYLAVAGIGTALVLAASWIPARRAARIDPASILRHQ
jgi:ABC-type antimicrobial peptide transport system permease subunit